MKVALGVGETRAHLWIFGNSVTQVTQKSNAWEGDSEQEKKKETKELQEL